MDYIKDLYDLEQTLARDWLAGFRYPWEALSRLGDFIVKLGESLPREEYREIFDAIIRINTLDNELYEKIQSRRGKE